MAAATAIEKTTLSTTAVPTAAVAASANGEQRDTKLVEGKQVRVNGIVYDICKDELGVYRFLKQPSTDKLNLNHVSLDFQEGRTTTRECAEAFMSVGYSIDGWCDAIDDLLEICLDDPRLSTLWFSAKLRKENDGEGEGDDDDDDGGDDDDNTKK